MFRISNAGRRLISSSSLGLPGLAVVQIKLSMTKRNGSSTPASRLIVVGAWVAGIVSVGGLVAMVLIAIDKVSAGHGLDTFRTKWMVEDNWIGFLVFAIVTTVVLLAAAIIGWFQRRSEQREVQQLHAKYAEEHHG